MTSHSSLILTLFVFSVFMHLFVCGVSDSEYMFDKLSNVMMSGMCGFFKSQDN